MGCGTQVSATWALHTVLCSEHRQHEGIFAVAAQLLRQSAAEHTEAVGALHIGEGQKTLQWRLDQLNNRTAKYFVE